MIEYTVPETNVSVPTVAKMQVIAQQYRQQTGHRLCVNDMSLNWGGVFDLGPNYKPGYHFWNPPHAEHRLISGFRISGFRGRYTQPPNPTRFRAPVTLCHRPHLGERLTGVLPRRPLPRP